MYREGEKDMLMRWRVRERGGKRGEEEGDGEREKERGREGIERGKERDREMGEYILKLFRYIVLDFLKLSKI